MDGQVQGRSCSVLWGEALSFPEAKLLLHYHNLRGVGKLVLKSFLQNKKFPFGSASATKGS